MTSTTFLCNAETTAGDHRLRRHRRAIRDAHRRRFVDGSRVHELPINDRSGGERNDTSAPLPSHRLGAMRPIVHPPNGWR